jgi:hypothetical protein
MTMECVINPPDRRVIADTLPRIIETNATDHCHRDRFSAKVRLGRTQAVYFLKRGSSGAKPPAVQEFWSRGCLRAHVSYLVFACWPSWQLAHPSRKLLLSKHRSPPSLPSQASTSDLTRRADPTKLSRHADFPDCFSPRRIALGLSARFGFVIVPAPTPFMQDPSLC